MSGANALARAYVFDFDGTLGTIPVDWARVKEGLRELTGSQEEFTSVFPAIIQVLEKHPKDQRRVFALIDEYEVAAAPSATLYQGAFDLLSVLSQTAKISLVTMQGSKATEILLRRFNLKQFFLRSFTREDSLERGEQIRFALEAMGADREASVFVGDRLNDLRAAKEVGVPFTMIRTHGEDPEDSGVRLYHSVAEFLEAIGR